MSKRRKKQSRKVIHLRLPRGMMLAIGEMADRNGEPVASLVRRTLLLEIDSTLKARDPQFVPDSTRAPMTFIANEAFARNARQAALKTGMTVNGFYTHALAKRLGVLPCLAAAEGDERNK